MTSSIIVVRFPNIKWDEKALLQKCSELATATYLYRALHEDAPFTANCVTAIGYVVSEVAKTSLPRVWIGNMPRRLKQIGCQVLSIHPSELKTGDFLFVKEKGYVQRLITHVGMVIGQKIFHCSKERNVTLDSFSEFFERYNQAKSVKALIDYVDRRNDLALARL